MIDRDRLAGAVVVVGLVLLVVPMAVPLQPVLTHQTYPGTPHNESVLEERGFEVVEYENLSERGQELYVRALRNGGRLTVPADQGAPDFAYPTNAERANADEPFGGSRMGAIVIERPPNADLPPADEPLYLVEELKQDRENREGRAPYSDMSEEELRQQIARYEVMETGTTDPELTSLQSLSRLLAALVGVLAIGTGGYLRAKP